MACGQGGAFLNYAPIKDAIILRYFQHIDLWYVYVYDVLVHMYMHMCMCAFTYACVFVYVPMHVMYV